MALRTDKAVEIFSALGTGDIRETEIEVAEARAAIKELAKNQNPVNRWEIAQLLSFVVNNIIDYRTTYIDYLGDVKRVAIGEKASFKIKKEGINAFLQAKNGTTQRSRIMHAYTDIDTIEVSARPYVNLYELAAGKVNFDEIINDAANEMEYKMVNNIETTLYAAFSGYASPNYASGSGVVAGTLDPMVVAFQRLGNVTLLGDISIISKLSELTGFTNATNEKQFDPSIIGQHNQNGYIGVYKGANVVKMLNGFQRSSLTNTLLKKDVMYILPAGVERPLKVVFEGNVESMDATNINDNTMDVVLRKYFGSAVVYGDNVYMGVYEDTSL